MLQAMVEHRQGFAFGNDGDFAGRTPWLEIVSECLSKAAGMTLEGFGYQVEDMAKQGVALFKEAAAQETTGLTEVREAVDAASEGEEESGEAGAEAGDGVWFYNQRMARIERR